MQHTTNKSAPTRPIETEVDEMIKLMHDFSILLERENEFLHGAKFKQIETLQNDKRSHVAAYKEKLAMLFERKDEFSRMDHSLAEKLIRARTDFIQLLNKNLRILATAKNSSRRLVQRILTAACDTVEEKTNYNAAGAMMRSNPQTATSVGFNQEL